jgi:maleylpyruvate isomerase
MTYDATKPEQTLSWMRDGTERLLGDLASLSDQELEDPSLLPGWSRRYLVSHVAANADALRNLVHWARTGEERRMYASPEAREAGIRAGAARPTAELREWAAESAAALAADLDTLPDASWDAKIITAQGLTREAREIPWMRVREVCVHAVDLGARTNFADLPVDLNTALLDDITARRCAVGTSPALTVTASDTGGSWTVTGATDPVAVTGSVAELTAWLSGRPVSGLADAAGGPLPELPAWL